MTKRRPQNPSLSELVHAVRTYLEEEQRRANARAEALSPSLPEHLRLSHIGKPVYPMGLPITQYYLQTCGRPDQETLESLPVEMLALC